MQQAVKNHFKIAEEVGHGVAHKAKGHGPIHEVKEDTSFATIFSNMAEEFGHGVAHKAKGHGPVHEVKEDTSFATIFSNVLDMERPIYDVKDHYYTTGIAQAVARHSVFLNLCSLVIFLNAVYLGIDSDYNQASNLYDAPSHFIIIENFFCVFFTFEWLVRFFAFRSTYECFQDGWMRFDTFLAAMMVIETWIVMPLMKAFLGNSGVSIPMGPLRLLRLLKLTRMARMMKIFPELVTLVKGMYRSVRAISGTLLLVALILYTFAILIHLLMKNETEMNQILFEETKLDFETMPHCMWALGTAGVMLDGLTPISTNLVFLGNLNTTAAGWAFMLFSIISALTVLNMLIGILCEVVGETSKAKDAADSVAVMKSQIIDKLREFDDGDGLITLPELSEVLSDSHSKAILRSLNINELYMLQMIKLMFPEHDSAIAFKPLTEMMLKCRGDTHVTMDTMATSLTFLVNEIRESREEMEARMAAVFEELHIVRTWKEQKRQGKAGEHGLVTRELI
jgi:hypothetical protein